MGCLCEHCAEHAPGSVDACAFCARHCTTPGRGPDGRPMRFMTAASYRRAAHAARAAPRLPIPSEAELRQQATRVAVNALAPLVEKGVNTLWDAARRHVLRVTRR